MNLDEAIKYCEEVMMENLEKTKDRNASDPIAINCFECAAEHRQLAEWLKELKAYKEQGGDAISRKYILDLIATKGANLDDDLLIVEQWIQDAPSVNPHPIECGDAISRQAAIVQLSHNKNGDDDCDVIIQRDVETIKALPSVTPQQKMGQAVNPSEELAKAFTIGMAMGFGKNYDEMDKIMEAIKALAQQQRKRQWLKGGW